MALHSEEREYQAVQIMIGRKRHMLLVQLYITNESLLLDFPSVVLGERLQFLWLFSSCCIL